MIPPPNFRSALDHHNNCEICIHIEKRWITTTNIETHLVHTLKMKCIKHDYTLPTFMEANEHICDDFEIEESKEEK